MGSLQHSRMAYENIVKNGLGQHKRNLVKALDPEYWADRIDPDHELTDEDRLARGKAQIQANRMKGLAQKQKGKSR